MLHGKSFVHFENDFKCRRVKKGPILCIFFLQISKGVFNTPLRFQLGDALMRPKKHNIQR